MSSLVVRCRDLFETSVPVGWNPVRSKMKLFTKIMKRLKVVIHEVPKKNASIF